MIVAVNKDVPALEELLCSFVPLFSDATSMTMSVCSFS